MALSVPVANFHRDATFSNAVSSDALFSAPRFTGWLERSPCWLASELVGVGGGDKAEEETDCGSLRSKSMDSSSKDHSGNGKEEGRAGLEKGQILTGTVNLWGMDSCLVILETWDDIVWLVFSSLGITCEHQKREMTNAAYLWSTNSVFFSAVG